MDPFKANKLPFPGHFDPEAAGTDRSGVSAGKGPVRLGEGDLDPLGPTSPERGGMLLGPEHPAFNPQESRPPKGSEPGILPRGSVPPGARFDPITPLQPGRRTGDPDSDELVPPGHQMQEDELNRPTSAARALPGRHNAKPDDDFDDDVFSGPRSFGHPFGAPPSGSGRPPFFM